MSKNFIKKNIKLSLELNSYISRHPSAYKKIPRGAWVIITVKGDKDFNRHSMALAEKIKKMEKQKRIEARKEGTRWVLQPLAA